MKTVYTISLLMIVALARPAFALDIAEENQGTVTEFASSMEHVGMHYCKTCGKNIYTEGSFADVAPINLYSAAPKATDAKGAKSAR